MVPPDKRATYRLGVPGAWLHGTGTIHTGRPSLLAPRGHSKALSLKSVLDEGSGMCGRFAQYTPPSAVASRFGVDPQHVLLLDWTTRYNLAPSDPAMVVHQGAERDGRVLESMRWGFIPHWARDVDDMPHPINARAETVVTGRSGGLQRDRDANMCPTSPGESR